MEKKGKLVAVALNLAAFKQYLILIMLLLITWKKSLFRFSLKVCKFLNLSPVIPEQQSYIIKILTSKCNFSFWCKIKTEKCNFLSISQMKVAFKPFFILWDTLFVAISLMRVMYKIFRNKCIYFYFDLWKPWHLISFSSKVNSNNNKYKITPHPPLCT